MANVVEAAHQVRDGKWSGWLSWTDRMAGTFIEALGSSYFRSDRPEQATVMLETRPLHCNAVGSLHGGLLATFADHAYFAALVAMGKPEQVEAVTVDLSMQYVGPSRVGPDLLADVALLKETGRLAFMRLTIAQEGQVIAASTATIRKASRKKAPD